VLQGCAASSCCIGLAGRRHQALAAIFPGQVIVMTWLTLVFLVALALGCWRCRTDSRDGRDWTSVPPDTRTTSHCC
jgi:hypothetical protein